MPTLARRLSVKPAVFLLLGEGLFLIKFLIDRLVAGAFGRDWSFMNYLIPGETYTLWSLPPTERRFYLVMLAIALPFIVTGLLLTWWRLRDAGLPRWLVVLFFVPAVNLVLFAVVGLWPSKADGAELKRGPADDVESPDDPSASKPAFAFTSFVFASFAGAIIAASCVVIGVLVFRSYGWGAFVAAPFVCGMVAAWIHGYRDPHSIGESLGVAAVGLTMAGAGVLIAAFEGAVCLLMAAPLAFPVALLGGGLGHALAVERHRRVGAIGRGFEVLPALAIPLVIAGGEWMQPMRPEMHCVTTAMIIDAPAEEVWRHVASFPDLPPPKHWVFATGIAYPVRARIDGQGVGAIRHCEFSTGAFVEPITVWQPPVGSDAGLLRFDVIDSPPPLQEWSWTSIDPPHLHDFLVSRQGQFELISLPDGRTRLEGTTWYEHTILPDAYWRLWSDWIIGRVHIEVLDHVKQLAEAEAATRQ